MKRLYRSRKNRVFAGVAGGLGEYFGIDPVLIRLLWVVLIFFGGSGIIAYLLAWLIIPKEPEQSNEVSENENISKRENYSGRVIMGIIFLLLGAILLIRLNWSWWYDIKWYIRDFFKYAIPVGLIILGLYLIVPIQKIVKPQKKEGEKQEESQ